jgi:hypothetical protein
MALLMPETFNRPVSSLPVIQDAYGLIFRSIEDLPQLDRKFILSLREHFKIDYLLMDPEENISSEILEALGKGIVDNLVIRANNETGTLGGLPYTK